MADKEKSVLPKRTTDYDGLVKQIMNNMQDKNIIEFIGALFSKKYTKDSQLIRLCTETHDEKATQRRADFYPFSARRPPPLRWGMNCVPVPNVFDNKSKI